MDTLTIPAGTIVHVYGMPVRLINGAHVEGRRENFATEPFNTPEHSNTFYRIVGPFTFATTPEAVAVEEAAPCPLCHQPLSQEPSKPSPYPATEAERCDGRYPVGMPRDEPFDVTYRCSLKVGHEGPHGAEPLQGTPK